LFNIITVVFDGPPPPFKIFLYHNPPTEFR